MAHASAHEGNAPHVLTLLPPPPPPPQLPPPPLPRLLIRALPQTPLLQLQLLQHQPQPPSPCLNSPVHARKQASIKSCTESYLLDSLLLPTLAFRCRSAPIGTGAEVPASNSQICAPQAAILSVQCGQANHASYELHQKGPPTLSPSCRRAAPPTVRCYFS